MSFQWIMGNSGYDTAGNSMHRKAIALIDQATLGNMEEGDKWLNPSKQEIGSGREQENTYGKTSKQEQKRRIEE